MNAKIDHDPKVLEELKLEHPIAIFLIDCVVEKINAENTIVTIKNHQSELMKICVPKRFTAKIYTLAHNSKKLKGYVYVVATGEYSPEIIEVKIKTVKDGEEAWSEEFQPCWSKDKMREVKTRRKNECDQNSAKS